MLELIELVDVWEFYQNKQGNWRWTRIAATGEISGSSRKSYKNKADCITDARKFGYLG